MDNSTLSMSSPNFPKQAGGFRLGKLRASRIAERLKPDDDGGNKDGEASSGSDGEDDDPLLMDEEERQEWRRKIREVIDMNPDVEEEVDPVERRKKMQNLLADYPLVVEVDDPDWPEDSDGWGFSLGQFFDKIAIKNVKKDEMRIMIVKMNWCGKMTITFVQSKTSPPENGKRLYSRTSVL